MFSRRDDERSLLLVQAIFRALQISILLRAMWYNDWSSNIHEPFSYLCRQPAKHDPGIRRRRAQYHRDRLAAVQADAAAHGGGPQGPLRRNPHFPQHASRCEMQRPERYRRPGHGTNQSLLPIIAYRPLRRHKIWVRAGDNKIAIIV